MPKKRIPRAASTGQLVFPFNLRVGDIVLDDGASFEIVDRPTGASQVKMTRARVRREGEARRARRDVGGMAQTSRRAAVGSLTETRK